MDNPQKGPEAINNLNEVGILPDPPVRANSEPPVPTHSSCTISQEKSVNSESVPTETPTKEKPSKKKFQFQIPGRAIYNIQDLQHFTKSKTHSELMIFVRICNERIKGKKTSDIQNQSEVVTGLVRLLETLSDWVDEIPPLNQPMRFGNKAFRTWHERLVENAAEMVEKILPETMKDASLELSPYLCTSFGNETRIDYGTGHETNFVVFLCCLFKLKVIRRGDLEAVVLKVFQRYLTLMHKLQMEYVLEPAGSHGVWGLDDYHCLPFLWGAAQLIDHPDITPSSIHDEAVISGNKDEYLYLAGIDFVKQLKKGAPFAESSPMLNDISGIPEWRKVNTGMFRLYEGEVLSKFPVIQHFLFGSILPASWIPTCTGFEVPWPQSPGGSIPGSPGSPWSPLAAMGPGGFQRARSYSSNSTTSDDIPPLGPMSHAPWAPEPEPMLPSPSGSVRASRTNSFSLGTAEEQTAFRAS
mmetsp:Transcript_4514/g.6227  ORF Transcript_4514/g.6227 Transcript_4514/m.6227 type:complete len:469 (+) Transcript_4514:248-1654(+)